ncbi:MAG: group III truncated hemoglobin [Flavobacteriaceae bacterium]|jgi:hemoglobin|nr:group III truncated hemoglobin [Flavobacteriaceae bacterium]
MKDINNREDIELLVNKFYKKVKVDETIGYIFNEIANINWDKHLPKMYDFWETVLLGKMSFKGNPMLTHIKLSKKTNINKIHFNCWLKLWIETINNHFKGKIADNAKQRGQNITGLMLYKINNI